MHSAFSVVKENKKSSFSESFKEDRSSISESIEFRDKKPSFKVDRRPSCSEPMREDRRPSCSEPMREDRRRSCSEPMREDRRPSQSESELCVSTQDDSEVQEEEVFVEEEHPQPRSLSLLSPHLPPGANREHHSWSKLLPHQSSQARRRVFSASAVQSSTTMGSSDVVLDLSLKRKATPETTTEAAQSRPLGSEEQCQSPSDQKSSVAASKDRLAERCLNLTRSNSCSGPIGLQTDSQHRPPDRIHRVRHMGAGGCCQNHHNQPHTEGSSVPKSAFRRLGRSILERQLLLKSEMALRRPSAFSSFIPTANVRHAQQQVHYHNHRDFPIPGLQHRHRQHLLHHHHHHQRRHQQQQQPERPRQQHREVFPVRTLKADLAECDARNVHNVPSSHQAPLRDMPPLLELRGFDPRMSSSLHDLDLHRDRASRRQHILSNVAIGRNISSHGGGCPCCPAATAGGLLPPGVSSVGAPLPSTSSCTPLVSPRSEGGASSVGHGGQCYSDLMEEDGGEGGDHRGFKKTFKKDLMKRYCE